MRMAALGLVFAIALPAVCRAQTVVVPLPLGGVQEGTFSAGNQYYDAGISGFRDYLETIRASDPALYASLDDELDGIETDRTLAHVFLWGVGLGGGLTLLALTFLLHDDCGYDLDYDASEREERQWHACRDAAGVQDIALLGASIGVFAGGLITGLVLLPGRPSFLRMVNEHNRRKPSAPLRLGLSATTHHASASLVLSF